MKVFVSVYTRWFKYDRDDLCVNKSQFVPVIFEPPCISIYGNSFRNIAKALVFSLLFQFNSTAVVAMKLNVRPVNNITSIIPGTMNSRRRTGTEYYRQMNICSHNMIIHIPVPNTQCWNMRHLLSQVVLNQWRYWRGHRSLRSSRARNIKTTRHILPAPDTYRTLQSFPLCQSNYKNKC
jgi:hypothetical protein